MGQSNSPALALVGALIAGAVGGVGATLLSTPGHDSATDAAPVTLDGEGVDALRFDVATLRQENARLSQALEGLEARLLLALDAPRSSASPQPALAEGVEGGLAPEDAALLASLSNTDSPLPPEFRERVGQAMSEIRETEEAERDARREELFLEQLDERMDRYTERLGLAAYQENQLRDAILGERAQRNQLMDEARQSGDFGSLRESMRGVNEQTQTVLSGFLTAEQLEAYQSMDDRRGFGDFRGGGGGGGRPGGG